MSDLQAMTGDESTVRELAESAMAQAQPRPTWRFEERAVITEPCTKLTLVGCHDENNTQSILSVTKSREGRYYGFVYGCLAGVFVDADSLEAACPIALKSLLREYEDAAAAIRKLIAEMEGPCQA